MVDPQRLGSLTREEKLSLLRHITEDDVWDVDLGELLCRLSGDVDAEVRREALAALNEFAGLQYSSLLLERAAHDPSEAVRVQAVNSLAAYVYNAVIECELDFGEYETIRRFLIALAHDPTAPLPVRARAVESLAYDDAEHVCELIDWAYGRPEEPLRLAAVAAMGHSALQDWTATILSELRSEDRRMRLQAIAAAAEACIEDATPHLRNLALSGDRDVRLAAIEALAYAAGPGALEMLELCAKESDAELRAAAEEAIETYESYRDAEREAHGLLNEEEDENDDD